MIPLHILVSKDVHHSKKKKIFGLPYKNMANLVWPSLLALYEMENLYGGVLPFKFSFDKNAFMVWMEACKKKLCFRNIPHCPFDVFNMKKRNEVSALFSLLMAEMDNNDLAHVFGMYNEPKLGRISIFPYINDEIRTIDLLSAHRCADNVILVVETEKEIENKFGATIINLKKSNIADYVDCISQFDILEKPEEENA